LSRMHTILLQDP